MAQTAMGARKIAAKRIGVTLEEYIANERAGLKWCTAGRHWKPHSDFHKNPAKGDGLAQSCRRCLSTLPDDVPLRSEKRERLKEGLKWCNGCKQWLPVEKVKQHRCRNCLNRYERQRYARDRRYRQERRQHAHARKRSIDPITPEVQDAAMAKTGGLCAYCNNPADTFDHIVPITKGGSSELENINPACASCNSSKKNRDLAEWLSP